MLLLLPLVVTGLVACAPTVPLQPAADATNPHCAEIIVHLPTTVGNQAIRQTNAQATGAWGSPASVLLRCGVTPPGPSTDICYTIQGIDWLVNSKKDPIFTLTTYGRTPATQVIVDSRVASGTDVLTDLANAVGFTKQTRKCASPRDALGFGTPSPSPSP